MTVPPDMDSMAAFWLVVQASMNASASVVILVLLGVLATLRGVFDQKGISDLGKFVYNISLPSLIAANIMIEVNLERLTTLWVLPAFCSVQIILAFVFAHSMSKLLGLSEVERRPCVATIMFGNVGALAIAVVDNLCKDEPFLTAFGGSEHCTQKSVSYIAFYLITQNIWMFSWGHKILVDKGKEEQQPADKQEASKPLLAKVGSGNSIAKSGGRTPVMQVTKEGPGLGLVVSVPSMGDLLSHCESRDDMGQAEHKQDMNHQAEEAQMRLTSEALREVASRLVLDVKPWMAENHDLAVEEDEDASPMKPRRPSFVDEAKMRVRKWSLRRCFKGSRRRVLIFCQELKSMAKNPPIQAAILALCLGMWAPMKALFVGVDGEQAPLRSAFHAVQTLGVAQVPVSMFMLSGSGTLKYLDNQKQRLTEELDKVGVKNASFHFTFRAKCLMILGRIVAMPIIGYLSWMVFAKLGLLDVSHSLITFILLIESAVPSAQNVVMLMLVHGFLEQGAAMAEVVLLQYAISVPIFTLATSFFAHISISHSGP